MSITIGEITFDTMDGQLEEPGSASAVHERRGEDGAEVIDLGLREAPATLTTTVTVADDEAALAAVEAHKALQVTILAVEDARGNSHASVLIERASPEIVAVVNPTSNPAHTRMIRTQWTVRKLYVESV